MIKCCRIVVLTLTLLTFAVTTGSAQGPSAAPSVVVRLPEWSRLTYEVPGLGDGAERAHQSVMTNTGWRTAIFAAGGGLLAAAITAAVKDEPGIHSAELTAFVAGAVTGVVASLWLGPKLFGKS